MVRPKRSRFQCVTVPKMLNDTDTFFRYQIFSLPTPILFLVPDFSDTGSETFSRYQISEILLLFETPYLAQNPQIRLLYERVPIHRKPCVQVRYLLVLLEIKEQDVKV